MHQLLNLYQETLQEGEEQENRTSDPAIVNPGGYMKFVDIDKNFPATTTKKLYIDAVFGEGVAFLQGKSSAKDFRDYNCKVWDQNANENEAWLNNPFRLGEDDLGGVYGVQWRKWPAYRMIDPQNKKAYQATLKEGFSFLGYVADTQGLPKALMYKEIDQVTQCLETIKNNPNDRRILFHAWNPAELSTMALPPCHLLYQLIPQPISKRLSMSLYVRSNDLGLGAPFNIAEAAFFLHLFARFTGYTPYKLCYHIGNAHVYKKHLDMVTTMLSREPLDLPQLYIDPSVPKHGDKGTFADWLKELHPSQFKLLNYKHHAAIKAPMAV